MINKNAMNSPQIHIVNTKINLSSFILFNSIVKKRGISFYSVLKVIVDCLIKCLSPECRLDDHTKKILKTFCNIRFLRDRFTLSDPVLNDVTCNKCIMLVEKPQTKYEEPILIRNPKQGEKGVIYSRNEDDILRALLHSIAPEGIKQLEAIKDDNDLLSLSQALKYAIGEVSGNAISIEEEIMELFSDNERSEFGKKIEYDEIGKYKRKHKVEIN